MDAMDRVSVCAFALSIRFHTGWSGYEKNKLWLVRWWVVRVRAGSPWLLPSVTGDGWCASMQRIVIVAPICVCIFFSSFHFTRYSVFFDCIVQIVVILCVLVPYATHSQTSTYTHRETMLAVRESLDRVLSTWHLHDGSTISNFIQPIWRTGDAKTWLYITTR